MPFTAVNWELKRMLLRSVLMSEINLVRGTWRVIVQLFKFAACFGSNLACCKYRLYSTRFIFMVNVFFRLSNFFQLRSTTANPSLSRIYKATILCN